VQLLPHVVLISYLLHKLVFEQSGGGGVYTFSGHLPAVVF